MSTNYTNKQCMFCFEEATGKREISSKMHGHCLHVLTCDLCGKFLLKLKAKDGKGFDRLMFSAWDMVDKNRERS